MNKRQWLSKAVIAAVLFAVGLSLPAQAGLGRGRLSGTVHDEQGNPVVGAVVWLEFAKSGKRLEGETDGQGGWVFNGIGSGKARITVLADGYQGVVLNALVSQLQVNRAVKVVLKPRAAKPLLAALLENAPAPAAAADKPGELDLVTRSYSLKHVTPAAVCHSLNLYIYDRSFEDGSPALTVKLPRKDVAAFEAELRKLDVPRRNILLRVFTVIASREGRGGAIENRDLKRVLEEVSHLLNFKSYTLDGASVVTVKEGARRGELLLASDTMASLRLQFGQVALVTGADGRRAVRLSLDLYQQQKDGLHGKLLETETEVAENGYLVAGVSRLGGGGQSLVLVVNAEIR